MTNTKYTEDEFDHIKYSVDLQDVVEDIYSEMDGSGNQVLCPFHEEATPSCTISDDFYYCFGCGEHGDVIDFVSKVKNLKLKDSIEFLINEYEIDMQSRDDTKEKRVKKVKPKTPAITQKEASDIKARSSLSGNKFRGIGDEVLKKSQCRTEYKPGTKEVLHRYYPITETNSQGVSKQTGFKVRVCDPTKLKAKGKKKDFYGIGRYSTESDLYGTIEHPNGGRTCLIVGGEEDKHAAEQMLLPVCRAKGWNMPVVLSPVVGENSIKNQVRHNYKYLDKFDEIIIGFDNDEAGKKATQEALSVLPKDKAFTVEWRLKDPNDYLDKGMDKDFCNDYWRKKKDLPMGVIGSGDLTQALLEEIDKDKIPLPEFMRVINEMTIGGLERGRIVNVFAGSGVGKTTIIGEVIYQWIINQEFPMICSFENNKGQYAQDIYSRHLGKAIKLIPNKEEKKKYIEDNLEKINDFIYREDGSNSFLIVDDTLGKLEDFKKLQRDTYMSEGADIMVFDPLNDLFEGLGVDDQEDFMNWEKRFVKEFPVLIFNVCHMNKAGQSFFDKEGNLEWPTGDFTHGSSTIYKSGAVNIFLARNEKAECEVERNTTYTLMKKNRLGNTTGPAGKFYYDGETHKMHDFDTYFEGKKRPLNKQKYKKKVEDKVEEPTITEEPEMIEEIKSAEV